MTEVLLAMDRLTPRQIVAELDKYIIGQHEAKRAVAIALRNRWRRQRLPAELRDENPTGTMWRWIDGEMTRGDAVGKP